MLNMQCKIQQIFMMSLIIVLRQNLVGSLLTTEWSAHQSYEFSIVFTLNVFENHEAQNLNRLFAKLYTTDCNKININMTYKKYKYVIMNSIKMDSSTPKKSSVVMAMWNDDVLGEIVLTQAANPIDTYQCPI